MAFQLDKGVFRVKCGQKNCPFNAEFKIKQNIMGLIERDVEVEAIKIARDMASIKHDAMYGRNHLLKSPVVRKVAGTYIEVGARKSAITTQTESTVYRDFRKGEIILAKGEVATTICEVVKGIAYAEKNKKFQYKRGDIFGSSALMVNQGRMLDIIAGQDGTKIAFHNLRELSKIDPDRTKEIYYEAMEDIFDVVKNLEDIIEDLERKLEREVLKSRSQQDRIKSVEKEFVQAQKAPKARTVVKASPAAKGGAARKAKPTAKAKPAGKAKPTAKAKPARKVKTTAKTGKARKA